ncbi:hypothetical protein BpHYR1_051988 [Brachionus plicatilis]|uniref:Uncharacterized protein n=1 Tax=Brachionus plicatilis TaxID=10195 RepID=A0A3M7R849_BRAPC|nr:hypothetical protein BpHYR1_051988 [Brachionus plicatilis]
MFLRPINIFFTPSNSSSPIFLRHEFKPYSKRRLKTLETLAVFEPDNNHFAFKFLNDNFGFILTILNSVLSSLKTHVRDTLQSLAIYLTISHFVSSF